MRRLLGVFGGRRQSVVVVISVLAAGLGIFTWMQVQAAAPPFEHPPQRVSVAHAALNAAETTGCAKCHTVAITKQCSDCHTAPNTPTLNGVKFPHHTAGAEGPKCNECHGQNGDARYAIIPQTVDHAYCTKCHELQHE